MMFGRQPPAAAARGLLSSSSSSSSRIPPGLPQESVEGGFERERGAHDASERTTTSTMTGGMDNAAAAGLFYHEAYTQQRPHNSDRDSHANTEDSVLDEAGWASPREVLQFRALTRQVIERYQAEVTRLSRELLLVREQRDQCLRDIHDTLELKKAFLQGKELSEASRRESRRTAEAHELLRLEMQKLMIDNERLRLALAKGRQQQQQGPGSQRMTALTAAVPPKITAPTRGIGKGHGNGGRGGGSDGEDRLSSPYPTVTSLTAVTDLERQDEDRPRESASLSMPAAVDPHYHYLERVTQHGQRRQGDGEAGGGDEEEGDAAASERHARTHDEGPSAAREGTGGEESRHRHHHHHQHQQQQQGSRSESSRETATLHDEEKEVAAFDETRAHVESTPRKGMSSSITTPSPSDVSYSSHRPDDYAAAGHGNRKGEQRDGACRSTSVSSHPDYAQGASEATATAEDTASTILSGAGPKRRREGSPSGLPTTAGNAQRQQRQQQCEVPEAVSGGGGGGGGGASASSAFYRSPSSANDAATSPVLTGSTSMAPPSAASSVPFLYQFPRTPAEALAVETRLREVIAALQGQGESLRGRVTLLERLLSNQQAKTESQRALQARENETLKRRVRELSLELQDTHAALALAKGERQSATEDAAAVEQALTAAEAALQQAKDGEQGRLADAVAAAKAECKREADRVRHEANERVAAVEAELRALHTTLEKQRAEAAEALKAAFAASQQVEKALAEERRRRKSLEEELGAAHRLYAVEQEARQQKQSALVAALETATAAAEASKQENDSWKAQVEQMMSERETQEELIKTMDRRLAVSCEQLLAFEETQQALALRELQVEEAEEARELLEARVAAQSRVMQSALSQQQRNNDASCKRVSDQLEKARRQNEALRIRCTALLKGGVVVVEANEREGVVPRGKAKSSTRRGRRSSPTESQRGKGDGGEGGEILSLDVREVLKASTEAVAQIARSICRV